MAAMARTPVLPEVTREARSPPNCPVHGRGLLRLQYVEISRPQRKCADGGTDQSDSRLSSAIGFGLVSFNQVVVSEGREPKAVFVL
jgi:hypothetical protein